MKLPWAWMLLSITCLACSGSRGVEIDASGSRPEVTRGDLVTRLLLTGELVAEDAETLMVPNANIWPMQIRWLAEDGVEVAEGDRLVEFDNSQLASSLEDMHTRVIEAANRLDSLQAQAASEASQADYDLEQTRAERDKAGLKAAIPESLLGEQKYQQHQLAFNKLQLSVEEAQAKLESTRQAKQAEVEIQRIALDKARGEVESAETRLELLTLRASRAGILIIEDHQREGRPIQAGDSIFPGNVVGRLPVLSTMIVEADLSDVDDGRVAAGMKVIATLDAFPQLTFNGKVRNVDAIADQPSSRSRRRFFRVRIDLERLDLERMRPGMSLKLVIEQTLQDVLQVPRRSLDFSSPEPRALLADGTWVPVSIGACNAQACMAESGIEEGIELGLVTASLETTVSETSG